MKKCLPHTSQMSLLHCTSMRTFFRVLREAGDKLAV
jgi:hypothetical protein